MDINLKQSLTKLMAKYNSMHSDSSSHDGRYYTKPQMDEFMSSIVTESALTDLKEQLDDEVTRATTAERTKAPINSPIFEGIPITTTPTLGNSTQQIATTEFVQLSIDDKILNSDAMIIKGTLGEGGTVTELPSTYKVGWSYKIVTEGEYAGQSCEVGDIITAFVSRNEGDIPIDSDWTVTQTNINGTIITGVKNEDGYIDINRIENAILVNHKDISVDGETNTSVLSFGSTFNPVTGIEYDSKGHITKLLTTSFTLPSYTMGSESSSGLTRLYTSSGQNTDGAMTQKAITDYVDNHSHNYAGSNTVGGDAINALKLSGYPISTSGTKDVWGTIPSIGGNNGIMGVGKYLDFHSTDASTVDYDVRITASISGLTISGTTEGTFSGPLLGNATSSSSCSGNSATATALTSSAGSLTKPIYFNEGKPEECSYTLGSACEKSYVDASLATSISSDDTGLMTQRAIYYGLPNINDSHSYTSDTTIYTPTSVGSSGYILKSEGSGAPSWADPSELSVGHASKLTTERMLTIGNTGKTFSGDKDVSWSLSEIGAAAAGHSHEYIPLNGTSSITGALKWNNTNYGIHLAGSYLQIGDLGDSNGGYTQIMNDCVAKYAMTVNGDLQVNSSLTLPTYSKIYETDNSVCFAGRVDYNSQGLQLNFYTDDQTFLTPISDGGTIFGSPETRWGQIYSTASTISTSDRNMKSNIKLIDNRYREMFYKLVPSSFTFNDGTSGRTHIGFISQDVESAMDEAGITAKEFGGFCKDIICHTVFDENGNPSRGPLLDENGHEQYVYSLRYEEFIALNTAMIQDLKSEIEELREKIDSLV